MDTYKHESIISRGQGEIVLYSWHTQCICSEGELAPGAAVKNSLTVHKEGWQ